MPRPTLVVLSTAQQQELQQLCTHHHKPYVRERAAAILKVAAGLPVSHVAATGWLTVREPETVSTWIRRYLDQGAAGLLVLAGRGRKPAFSPSTRRRCKRPDGA